ncbi:MAG: hypothetical protein NTY35_08850 [Planctomycetota bacterium]|nr:hypothetical protein [Planctomycetota bacterium]
MLRRSLLALLALAPAAPAQQVLPGNRLHPITAPIRSAGVLHVASGTWTRKASAASLGADVIYNNTCDDAYYSGLSGDTYITNGRVPSPTSPTNLSSRPGCATSCTVDGFEIAYCTDQPVPGVITVDFFNAYGCCGSVIGLPPTASIPLAGLPGSASGASVCWTVVIDLEAPSQPPGSTFVLIADRDGSYNGPANSNNDGFGWSIRSSLTGVAARHTGPLIASGSGCQNCNNTDFDGTRWDSVIDYTETGTGMGTCSAFQVEGGVSTPGCYFFGGCPDPNFHLRLYADACPGTSTSLVYCLGNAPSTACPCGNSAPSGTATGCRNSLGVGGRLRSAGLASLQSDSFVLNADQMPANAPTLYFQGTLRQNGGLGTPFGDGLRCAAGMMQRLGIETNTSPGASHYPATGDLAVSAQGQITVPGTRTYQAWYRNSASYCTSAAFNLTNGLELAWAP